jgi:hypothetical protein
MQSPHGDGDVGHVQSPSQIIGQRKGVGDEDIVLEGCPIYSIHNKSFFDSMDIQQAFGGWWCHSLPKS